MDLIPPKQTTGVIMGGVPEPGYSRLEKIDLRAGRTAGRQVTPGW